MPDAPNNGWVRMKRAGTPDDAPTAVVTAEAFNDVWSQKKDGSKPVWVLVDDKAPPAPTPEQVAEPTQPGGKS